MAHHCIVPAGLPAALMVAPFIKHNIITHQVGKEKKKKITLFGVLHAMSGAPSDIQTGGSLRPGSFLVYEIRPLVRTNPNPIPKTWVALFSIFPLIGDSYTNLW